MAHRARTSKAARVARHNRVRIKVSGTGSRPRLAVYRSLRHIYAQVIDDDLGRTVSAASSLEPTLRDQIVGKPKREVASLVGELIAERARAQGASKVIFDRGGFKYGGRVRTLAEAARKGGLDF